MRRTWIKAVYLAAVLLSCKQVLCGAPESMREKYKHWAQLSLERMEQEGLSAENRYLKGQAIVGATAKFTPWPFAHEFFPYQWDFDDGTLCGINDQGGGLRDCGVTDGKLKFATDPNLGGGYFSWGNFDPAQKAIRFGFNRHNRSPLLGFVEIRLRQSLPESKWRVSAKQHAGGITPSPELTIKGTNWQTVLFPFHYPKPPYTGVRVTTTTPGNEVEIDWVKPYFKGGRPCYRKTFTLPAGARWAKCSIASGPFYKLYVNGQLALDSGARNLCSRQIWNYDLDAKLFRPGANVIAVENELIAGGMEMMGYLLLDAALVCDDGSYHRFDTDTSWKFKQGLTGQEWIAPEYDDAAWPQAILHNSQPTNNPLRAFWFNPSYKGRIAVEPADGRTQPVYGSQETIALKISAPLRQGATPAITWQVFDEMGDGFHAADRLVEEGNLKLETGNWKHGDRGAAGTLAFSAGELPGNVAYAVVFRLMENNQEVEKRRYEIAVCGPFSQPVVDNPDSYTNGMDLKLVWETDAAAPQPEGEFISCDGWSKPRDSKVIETPPGKFRTPYDEQNMGTAGGPPANYISFKYTIKHPGRPHVALAEYPDDTERIQEMRLNDSPPWPGNCTLGNDTAFLGHGHPLSHEIRRHHAVFFPNETSGTVTFLQLGKGNWTPDKAARVGRIWIYEILNDIPVRRIVNAPGPVKWLGQQPEAGPRQVMQSCFSSPIAELVRTKLILSDTPNFYRNWMVTGINMIKRLRFAGENSYHFGQFMYDHVLYPSEFSEYTAFGGQYAGQLRDCGVLLAKLFEANDLALFSEFELWAVSRLGLDCSDDDLADGVETLGQVDKRGKRYIVFNRKSMIPNWIHPQVRTNYFEKIMNEIIGLYGREKGWKGITLQVNEALGPCWMSKEGDPYFASYDDYTIALFEKETGVKIPAKAGDKQRFTQRYDWLMANPDAKQAWTSWRCDKMAELYDWVKARLKATRPDLQFVLFAQGMSYMAPPFDEQPVDALPTISDYARRGGLDIERFVKDQDTVVALNVHANSALGTSKAAAFRARALDQRIYDAMSNDGQNGIAMRFGWYEAQPGPPENWLWTSPDGPFAEAWLFPGAEYFSDYWTQVFIRANPTLIIHSLQDVTMWNGRETSMSRFAQAFRSIPAAKYQRLTGNGRDRNIWIAVCAWPDAAALNTEHRTLDAAAVYGYIANPQWWPADARVAFGKDAAVFDLIANQPVAGPTWRVALAPYEIRTFRIAGAAADTAVVACAVTVGDQVSAYIETLVSAAEKQLADSAEVLRRDNREAALRRILREVQDDLSAGDFDAAFETITSYRYTSLWSRTIVNHKPGLNPPKRLEAGRRTAPLAVDGEFDEWPTDPGGGLQASDQVFPASEDIRVFWEGTNDLSGTVRAQWDADNLYLALAIKDDVLYFHPSTFHRGDSTEVYINMDLTDANSSVYSTYTTHLNFAPPANGKEGVVRISRKRGGNGDSLPVTEISAAWKRTAAGCQIEAQIPWKLLREEGVKADMELGFDIMLNDAESAGQFKQWMVWSARRTNLSADPSSFGRMILRK